MGRILSPQFIFSPLLSLLLFLADKFVIPIFLPAACKSALALPSYGMTPLRFVNQIPCLNSTAYTISTFLKLFGWIFLVNSGVLLAVLLIKKGLTWKRSLFTTAGTFIAFFILFLLTLPYFLK
jgi:hypothetical protein